MPESTYDKSQSISRFLDAVASRQPIPGGGAVAALTGALAGAIGEMVLAYSTGKSGAPADQDQKLRSALVELNRARGIMLELMVEDQAAFAALSAERRRGGTGEKERAFAAALLACIRVPQAVAATAGQILSICERVAPVANRYLLSDLAVCAELAAGTVRAAGHMFKVNLTDISAAERARLTGAIDAQLAAATASVRRVMGAIAARQQERGG
ncbi:MAG: cyclodeaminase/cyclohydrolase family protein [Tepidisphaeraceae bacterium]